MIESFLGIERGTLEQLLAQKPAMEGARPTRARIYSEETLYTMDGSTAVIDVYGVMARQESFWSWYLGYERGANTERLRAVLAQADADLQVKSILLRINSPGGEVDGTSVVGEDLVALNTRKPVIAYVEGMACSCGYWLASQCREIWLESETTLSANIGILTVRRDSSKMYKDMGVEVRVFGSDELKGEGTPGTPLTKKQAEAVQEMVDALYAQFVAAVATGRKLSEETIRGFGSKVFIGSEAVRAGLADGVCSYSAAMERLNKLAGTSGTSTSRSGYSGQQETRKVKHLFAAALAAIGLTGMAGKVMAVTEDNAESLAPVIAGQVNAEVEKRVSEHPLLAALKTAGVHDATTLTEMLAHAKEHSEGVQAKLQEEAIRALGQDEGVKAALGAASLPLSVRQSMLATFTAAANAKAGITATEGATRISATKPLPTAHNAETAATTGKKWDELTAEQRNFAVKSLYITDPAKQEAYAAEFLSQQAA